MKKGLYYFLVRFVLLAFTFLVFFVQCKKTENRYIVVYVSEDQVFSEPILRDFERTTGIKVKALYDTEEAKSTGAMNRLIAEKNNPQADVYWANEPIRAEVLKQKGICAKYISKNSLDIPIAFKDPQGYWTGFSARIRVFAVNKKIKNRPKSILAYIDPKWKGRGVIANPLFGTTTSQIAALFTIWGDTRGKEFLTLMKRNKIAISTSNGESADFVASGHYDFSLVDSDDVINRMRQGKPIDIVYPDQGKNEIGCFVVPNVVILIKGAPHPKEGKLLVDYLLSPETERKLALASCAQIPLHPNVVPPKELKSINKIKIMRVNYKDIAKKLIEIQPFLKKWTGL